MVRFKLTGGVTTRYWENSNCRASPLLTDAVEGAALVVKRFSTLSGSFLSSAEGTKVFLRIAKREREPAMRCVVVDVVIIVVVGRQFAKDIVLDPSSYSICPNDPCRGAGCIHTTVFGTSSPNRPRTTRPLSPPSISMSKKTLWVTVWLKFRTSVANGHNELSRCFRENKSCAWKRCTTRQTTYVLTQWRRPAMQRRRRRWASWWGIRLLLDRKQMLDFCGVLVCVDLEILNTSRDWGMSYHRNRDNNVVKAYVSK